MVLGCTDEGASFVYLDDLDNISVLLHDNNDLEEEITHFFNEVFLLSILKKKHNLSKYTQNMYRNTV